ncbi:MAG: TolC family protein [Planctomycetota bacterium]
MIRFTKLSLNWLLIGGLLLGSDGCSRSERELKTPVEAPGSFSMTGTEPALEQWWRAFGDENLDALVDKALTDNFDLQTAWDRLAQAQAIAQKADAPLWPQADLSAGAKRSRQETGGSSSYGSLYSVGLAARYEVDLWSRLSSASRGAWLDVQARQEGVNTAAITLSASIANTWYQLAEAKGLVRITLTQIQTNEDVLKIVIIRWRKGAAQAADFYRQRQLVASTEAQLIAAKETVELLQYQLSVLIGNRPELAWQQVSIELPQLPLMPEVGVSADVLLRRPDVRQSHRQVQAADQRLAAAIADQYPRISISASAETTSTASVRDLFDDWLANLAANALEPLFDANLRKAEVRRQKAIVSEQLHAWGQTIVDALEDVEGALTRQRQQTELLENLKHQLDLARRTYERNRESYIKGQVDYIRVLESLESMQSLERNVLRAQRTVIQNRIDLHRAIAGSWDMKQPAMVQTHDLTGPAPNPGNITENE